MNPDSNDDGFDDFATAAGAALRRPAPDNGLAGVRSSLKRRRVTQTVVAGGAAVILLAAGALLLGTNQDNSQRLVPVDDTVSTSPDPSTSTSAPPTTAVVAPTVEPVRLTGDTPMLWANGVLVAAWVDGGFVPAAMTTGLPSEMLGTPMDLTDRTRSSSPWTPEPDDCGITRLRSTDSNDLFGQGYLWSPDYPIVGTLDGGSPAASSGLDNALSDLGLDPSSVDTLVPSADLDGDPDAEVVIVRYDPATAPTDPRSAVWLAVWDPGAASITTLVGDPVSNDTHFTAFGDGIADLDANGLYDTAIDTGDTVTLIELSTGTVLSTVDTSCPTQASSDIELRVDGIGPHSFGAAQSVVEATLTEAFGAPEVIDEMQPPQVVTCVRWGCSDATVLHWPNTGLVVAFSDRSSAGDLLEEPVLEAWTLTPTTPWWPGDIYVPEPGATPTPMPDVRLALANGIGLGSTVSELRSAYPSTAEGLWSDSSFVPTGFYVPDANGTTTIDGDVAWDVVTQLQSALVAEGAALTVNGVAGPDTAAALTAYSERAGLDGAPAAFDALGITGPPPEAMVVRLSAGDWFWELSCGGLEPLGIASGC